MRIDLKSRSILGLVTCAALGAGVACSGDKYTAPADPATTQVSRIYAVDSANGFLPDVLIYSSAPATAEPVTPDAPHTYTGFRVEFNQRINPSGLNIGTQVYAAGAQGTGPLGITNQSFCAPSSTGTPALAMRDVTNGHAVRSSVCYDPTSAPQVNPHLTVLIGAGETAASTAGATSPFTCHDFTAAGGGGDNPIPANQYAFDLNSAALVGASAGAKFQAPSGGGWTSSGNTATFTFSTDDAKFYGFGYQDGTSGFFYWLDKPERGMEWQVGGPLGGPMVQGGGVPAGASVSSRLCAACVGNFLVPADSTPLLAVFSDSATMNASVTGPGFIQPGTSSSGSDSRTVAIQPAGNWEPTGKYTIAVSGATVTTTATKTVTLPNPTYTVQAYDVDLFPLVSRVAPFANAPGLPAGTGPNGINIPPTNDGFTIAYPEIVDAGSISSITMNDTTNGGAGTPVALQAPTVDSSGFNVTVAPVNPLNIESQYTVTANSAKVAAGNPYAGTAMPTQFSFRTRNFHSVPLSSSAARNVAAAKIMTSGFTVTMTDPIDPATLSAVTLSTIDPDGTQSTIDPSQYTVTPVSGSTTKFLVKMVASTPVKFNETYIIQVSDGKSAGVKDQTDAHLAKADGCQISGACVDKVQFSTIKLGIKSISISDPNFVDGKFTISFFVPVDPTTVNPASNVTVRQIGLNNGILDPKGPVSGTPVAFTCTPPAAGATSITSISCQTNSPPAPNTMYLINFGVQNMAPALPSTQTKDSSKFGTFSGSLYQTFLSGC